MEKILKNLDKFNLFAKLNEKEILEILRKIDSKKYFYEKNNYIFFRNDELEGLYIILSGKVSGEMLKENGEIQKIENLEQGDLIASAFIFGGRNKIPVDLVAVEDTEILFFTKEETLDLFLSNKIILENYLNEISNKAQFLSERVWKSFNTKTISEKLNEYILENSQGDEVIFKHSIKDLAEIFNVSRPSLSRVLKKYIDENYLEKVKKDRYIIKNKKILK